jgi:amidase
MTQTTTNQELAFAGVREQAAMVARGEITSAELVDLSLQRIAEAQPALGAFQCVRAEEARAEAEQADARRAAGGTAPLLGVPIAVKDDVDVAGHPTHFGCDGRFDAKTEDSEIVRRLREAGAVIVGKTTSPELGQWPITEGPWFQPTRNPWNLEHTPGGSSGGASAAVAAGLVPGAIGSDGAGSVRIPAAWTNLVGVKPQRGRLSTWPDAEAFNGLTCFGPLTRTVGDAALMLDALHGNHPGDRHAPPAPPVSYTQAAQRPTRRLRIALSFRAPFAIVPKLLDDEVEELTRRTATLLRDLGHEVVERDPDYGFIGGSFVPRSTVALREWSERLGENVTYDKRTQENFVLGRLLAGPGLAGARGLEAIFRRRIGRMFGDVDVLLTPTTAAPPLPIGSIDGLSPWETHKVIVGSCPYAWAWNVLGWPGVSVPAGHTAAGLPVGAQLLGPANSEPLLLALAGELEQVERWHERRPPAGIPA